MNRRCDISTGILSLISIWVELKRLLALWVGRKFIVYYLEFCYNVFLIEKFMVIPTKTFDIAFLEKGSFSPIQ